MALSTKAKEAIKTGLAMVITYYIALAVGWDKPLWAGFAVAFCSLSSYGQSMNKAAMRMMGTLIGGLMALALFAFFIQQRWLFMLALSFWVGFCTYMTGGTKNQYFWNVCGFVCVIICFGSTRDSANIFEIAVLRTEQTALGILVYSVVAMLLWPARSGEQFKQSVVGLSSSQHKLYRSCFDLMLGKTAAQDTQTLRTEEVQQLSQFQQLLAAAETDTYEIGELRHHWHDFKRNTVKLSNALEEWRTDSNELSELHVRQIVPGLDDFNAELERRFSQIEGMLKKQQPEHLPIAVHLVPDNKELIQLTHFRMAALAVNLKHLLEIEKLTRNIFYCLSEIMGYSPVNARREKTTQGSSTFVLDPDRVLSFFRVMVILWAAYLSLIFVNDLPAGTGLVSMGGALGMAMASMPQLPASALVTPAAFGIALAGVLYIFVMPHLTTFWGLGILLFAVTFFFCYFFAAPRQMLGKLLGIAMFLSITGISNQQSYSFFAVANTALMFAILILILAICVHFPFNPRPERVFLRLVGRFYRSCEYLISTLEEDSSSRKTGSGALRRAYHMQVVAAVPGKLAMWAKCIDTRAFPGNSPEKVQAVVTSMQILAYRLRETVDVEDTPQSTKLLQGLLVSRKSLYHRIQRVFGLLSRDPGSGSQEKFHVWLTETGDELEARIQETLDFTSEKQFTDEEGIQFYSLLGTSRGLCGALLDYTGSAGAIDWQEWRKPRF